MDPTRAPDFKPPSPNEQPHPPLDPTSTIPKSGPIVPYVLADYNSSIDAPFNINSLPSTIASSLRITNKSAADARDHPNSSSTNTTTTASSSQRHSNHIPLDTSDFQPLSTEVSSEDDDDETIDTKLSISAPQPATSTEDPIIHIGVQKNQIADLEEVPHGIVRQSRSLDNYEFPTHRLCKSLQNSNKLPLVIVACGSFSPITYLHLRMFEMALDAINEQTRFEVIGGYYSPVSDNYQKPGLATASHRVRMCELACERTSSWLMVDAWESLQPTYQRTAKVLDHFNYEINVKRGGVATVTGEMVGVKIMLLAGGDLIESMGEPNVWADADLHHILGNYGCLIVERLSLIHI